MIRQCLPCNFLDVHAELGKAFANLPFPMIVFFTRQKRYLDCGWCVFIKIKGFKAKSCTCGTSRNLRGNYCIHYPHLSTSIHIYPQLQAVKSQGGILREGLKESFPKLSWKKMGTSRSSVVSRCCESGLVLDIFEAITEIHRIHTQVKSSHGFWNLISFFRLQGCLCDVRR